MPSKKKPQTPASVPHAVGDSIKVNLHNGKVVDATIRAIIDGGEKASGLRQGRDRASAEVADSFLEAVRGRLTYIAPRPIDTCFCSRYKA
jgi:hypothetical protein